MANAYRAWLVLVAVLTAALSAAAMLFNMVVDPWCLLDATRIPGINARKTRVEYFDRLYKAFAIGRVRPEVVILGSSRAEAAFRPEHPALARLGRGFNLALPNASIVEMRCYFDSARRAGTVRGAVVVLDLIAFGAANASDCPRDLEIARSPLRASAVFFSMSMLLDGVRTIGDQRRGVPAYIGATGQSTSAFWVELVRRAGGVRRAFEMDRDQYQKHMYRFDAAGLSAPHGRRALEAFRGIVGAILDARMASAFVVSPVHAEDFKVMAELGLLPLFESWKRDMVRILADEARKRAVPAPKLWDFSADHPYNREPFVSADGREATMHWWWGAAHYSEALGDRMLDRIFLGESDADFGIALDAANVDAPGARRDAGSGR